MLHIQKRPNNLDMLLSSIAAIGSFCFFLFVLTYGWVTAFEVMAR